MEGSLKAIEKGRHAGKWRVQYIQADELGRKSRLSRLFDSKTDGRTFLLGLRHGTKAEIARKSELTLGDWFDWLVLNDWPESLDAKTIAIRKGRFNKHVRDVFGRVPLRKVDPLRVRAFYRELRDQGIGDHTVHAVKANLVRVFNQAVTPYGRVPITYANPFRLEIQAPPLREAVALDPETAVAAIGHEDLSLRERAMLATFLLAGVRLSEQMALNVDQLLFDRDLIAVDRAVRLGPKGEQFIGLPKGDKKRMAVMCPALKAILRRLAEGKDRPRMKRSVYRTWNGILEKTGLPAEMSPHDCRLTHVNWIEKLLPGVSPTTLKEHVGHSSGHTVTEINYTRPLTPAQDILRNGLEKLVAAVPGGQAAGVTA